jgi:AcrR family transcriptional regulator
VPSRTWRQLPEDKRERVVDAALEEFGTNGFQAGSLNVVAREAEVAKGSLFRYFDDKMDLFAHVVEVCAEQVREEFVERVDDRAEQHDDAFELLRALLLDWVQYFRHAPLYRSLLFAATFEVDDEARVAAREVLDRHTLDVTDAMLDAAEAQGQLDAEGSREHLRALLLLLLPHLATAPSADELDPVLDLASKQGHALEAAVGGFVDVLEAAYRSSGQPSSFAATRPAGSDELRSTEPEAAEAPSAEVPAGERAGVPHADASAPVAGAAGDAAVAADGTATTPDAATANGPAAGAPASSDDEEPTGAAARTGDEKLPPTAIRRDGDRSRSLAELAAELGSGGPTGTWPPAP